VTHPPEISNEAAVNIRNYEENRIRSVYEKRRKTGLDSFFNAGYVFMLQDRERRVLSCLKRERMEDLETRKVLEIGCGTGYWLREFVNWGARPDNIYGIDLIPERIAEARWLCPSRANVTVASAAGIAYPDSLFDIVLQSTVFTSILDDRIKQQIAMEMLRLVRNDGLILWYDFHMNNPSNPNVRGIRKKEIVGLFPNCRVRLERITLAPPLVRRLAPISWFGCSLLGQIPLLCTHYLGVIRKRHVE
jgi:SAM-dependent methyltransferase